MSFLITRKPEKVFGTSVKISRWTGIGNPYIFEYTREDYHINNILIRPAYNTTKPTIWTTADPITLPLFIYPGDEIYIKAGLYDGVFTVFSITGNYVTLDTVHLGNSGSGRLNLSQRITNYKAFINIYHGVSNDLIDTVYPKPDSTGLLLNDVSGVIRSTVDTQAIINQTAINKANKGISGSFKIGYGATYTVVLPSTTIPVTIPETPTSPVGNDEKYYWVSAAKQITGEMPLSIDGVGQNLKEYVPKNLTGSDAKFLTMFEKPTYFEGFPFFLSFLYDEDFSTVYLDRHQQDVDINGTNVGAETDTTLNVSERGYVNQMKIRTPNAGTQSFDVWLETGATITGGYVEVGGVPIGAGSKYAE